MFQDDDMDDFDAAMDKFRWKTADRLKNGWT
jgi:hypothetical protein